MRTKPGGPPQYPDEAPPEHLIHGAAGRKGSVATREASSRKAQVDHSNGEALELIRMEATCPIQITTQQEGAKAKSGLQAGGSVASRANFRHHSQSARIGSVVFGKEPTKAVKKEDGMIEAIGSDAFAANFRGTISDRNLEDHFSTAAGKPSPSFMQSYCSQSY